VTDDFNTLQSTLFFSMAALLLALEQVPQLQRQATSVASRWTTNIGLMVIASVLVSLAIPMGIYAYGHAHAHEPFAGLGMPVALQVLLTFLILDFWRYWEHRVFHRVPLLWRAHLVHHSDTRLDVTTSERHHPFESILSTATLVALILYCGLPVAAVAVYVVVATAVSLYSHANLHFPASIDAMLRRVVVTPGFHAVHHSSLAAETDSNYGTVLTIWDRFFGTYVDPSKASIPFFGLDYFHQPRDITLARVLQQPLEYRVGMASRREPDQTGSERSKLNLSGAERTAVLGGVAGCILAALALWPTAADLAAIWAKNHAYQYAWFVIPMMVYALALERRSNALDIAPKPGFAGALVTTIASVLWIFSALANIDLGRHVALVLVVQGIAIAMVGLRGYWRLFPILALLFLAIPAGDVLEPLLRSLTLKSVALFASLAQLPYSADGFLVSIGKNRYFIAEECSGLSYVTLAIFLTYSFGLLIYRSLFKIAALTLLGAALALLSNVLRVNAIVLVDWLAGSQMDLSAHAMFQWLGLLTTLGLLFVVLTRVKADVPAQAGLSAPSAQGLTCRMALAPMVAGLVVLFFVGGFSLLPTDQSGQPRTLSTAALPSDLSGWTLVSPDAEWAVDDKRASESITLAYRREDQSMQVRIIETFARDAKLSDPGLGADDGKAWQKTDTERHTVCVESQCLPLLHSRWRAKGGHERHVYYTFIIGHFATDSRLAVRVAHAWRRLNGEGVTPRVIALVFDRAPDTTDDVAAVLLPLTSALVSAKLGQQATLEGAAELRLAD